MVLLLDMDSHDETDQVLMAGLPLVHHLEIKKIVPVRKHEAFASDIMQRWEQQTA